MAFMHRRLPSTKVPLAGAVYLSYSIPTWQQCYCCCVSLPCRDIWAIWGLRFVPDQTPEIMSVSQVLDKGYASCTGLSIFLVNACRAVGIPARLAGVQALMFAKLAPLHNARGATQNTQILSYSQG